MSTPIVVFDFDGVICDSTAECMVTSWNAWERWNKRTGERTTVEEFSLAEREAYRPIRPLARGAGEHYVLRRCLAEGLSLAGQGDYEEFCLTWSEDIRAYKDVFLRERDRFRKHALDDWIALHVVFPSVRGAYRRLLDENRAYIATLKDGESVRLILGAEGIKVPAARLLDQSQVDNKLDALNEVVRLESCRKEDLLLIDDNVTHLVAPAASGYPCLWTTWGNPPSDYFRIAKEQSIQCLSLEQLADVVNC